MNIPFRALALAFVSIITVSFFSFSTPVFAACGDGISGGAGTVGDPYQINDATELVAISSCLGSGNSGKYYKLMNNIDLNVAPYNTGSGWTPIGTGSGASGFYGKFDGDSHTISNLFINSSSGNIGLFGYISGGAIIENIILDSVNVTGGTTNVAALVGTSYGTVRNSAVRNGTLSGLMRLGALVGSNYSTGVVQRSFSDNVIITQRAAGGDCCVGGLTGATEFGGSISDSYARNSIIHTSSGQGVLGGIIGSTYTATSVARVYSTGPITTLSSFPSQVGGLTGNSGVNPTSSYWDMEASGLATSGSGTGKTTIQMKDQATYTGWDFDTIWAIDGVNNDGYPYL